MNVMLLLKTIQTQIKYKNKRKNAYLIYCIILVKIYNMVKYKNYGKKKSSPFILKEGVI